MTLRRTRKEGRGCRLPLSPGKGKCSHLYHSVQKEEALLFPPGELEDVLSYSCTCFPSLPSFQQK